MLRKLHLLTAGLAALFCMPMSAQNVKLKGALVINRYDDGDQMKSDYLGWNSELGKSIFIVETGIYAMDWDGTTLKAPYKEPAVVKSEIKGDNEKEIWANNFNLMYPNSGGVYVNGRMWTIMSRDEQSTTDDELFAVRSWDTESGDLLTNSIFPKSALLESAGMSYNPLDGKVYGLFYLTEQDLPDEIKNDSEYFEDEDGDASGTDAGYCLCTIDLNTMTITPITPGLYYDNFITFAINSKGRGFALTSGGTSGTPDADGKVRNIDNELSGAQLYEFDLSSGLKVTKAVQRIDSETGEAYTSYEPVLPATGYPVQYHRQTACFAKNNPNKMYWIGDWNSGKGINDWGSWSSLSDKEWRTNGKYDTALYEVDITTGEANRVAKVANRCRFGVMWADGLDNSDGAVTPEPTSIETVAPAVSNDHVQVYSTNGEVVYSGKAGEMSLKPGLYVIRNGAATQKVLVK